MLISSIVKLIKLGLTVDQIENLHADHSTIPELVESGRIQVLHKSELNNFVINNDFDEVYLFGPSYSADNDNGRIREYCENRDHVHSWAEVHMADMMSTGEEGGRARFTERFTKRQISLLPDYLKDGESSEVYADRIRKAIMNLAALVYETCKQGLHEKIGIGICIADTPIARDENGLTISSLELLFVEKLFVDAGYEKPEIFIINGLV